MSATARWVQTHEKIVPVERGGAYALETIPSGHFVGNMGWNRKGPSSFIIWFGKYKGRTLGEIMDDNPGYIDWLASQAWINDKTRNAVHAFLDSTVNQAIIEKRFKNDERQMDTQPDLFDIPSCHSKRFNLGRPVYIKLEYGPSKHIPDDAWKQEAERHLKGMDWRHRLFHGAKPTPTPAKPSFEERLFKRGIGEELPPDNKPQPILTPMEAWELAADLALAIDECECVEQLDILEVSDKIPHLRNLLPPHVITSLEDAYKAKRSSFSLRSLIPDREWNDALLAKEAIEEDPTLEPILASQAPDLYAVVQLAQLSNPVGGKLLPTPKGAKRHS